MTDTSDSDRLYSMKRVSKALSRFGLSENEIKIYLETLRQKESSPFTLAKQTGIPRTTVYDVLMSLSLKGLIQLQQSDGFSKQQTRIKPNNPSILRQILRDKRKHLTGVEIDILEILPQLRGEFHGDDANADFQFFPGVDGAKKVLFGEDNEHLDIPLCAFENLMPMDAFSTKDMDKSVDQDNEFRSKSKHPIKELVALTDWSKHVISYQYHRDPRYIQARQIRFIDNPLLNIQLRLAIKGTRLYITSAANDEIWGLIINSKSLSQTAQSLFEFMWHQATPITAEVVESWGYDEYREFELLYKK